MASSGRPKSFCSDRCRQASRKAIPAQNGLRYRAGPKSTKSGLQDTVLIAESKPETLSRKTKPPRFEKINEVTWKLTDGESTNVPASHGQWGGYKTAKAVAWVINVAPGQWLARCEDRACGPSPINEAKADAVTMARGACGHYFVKNPIAHLNGLQAQLYGPLRFAYEESQNHALTTDDEVVLPTIPPEANEAA
jgi:hypothetical protein